MEGTPNVAQGAIGVQSSGRVEQKQVAARLSADQSAVVSGVWKGRIGNYNVYIEIGTVSIHSSREQADSMYKDADTSGIFCVPGPKSNKYVVVNDHVLGQEIKIQVTLKDDREGRSPDPNASKVDIAIRDEYLHVITKQTDVERSLLESMGLNLDRTQADRVHGQVLSPQLSQYLLDAVR